MLRGDSRAPSSPTPYTLQNSRQAEGFEGPFSFPWNSVKGDMGGGETRAVLGLERGQLTLARSSVTLLVPHFRSEMSLLRLVFGALCPAGCAIWSNCGGFRR